MRGFGFSLWRFECLYLYICVYIFGLTHNLKSIIPRASTGFAAVRLFLPCWQGYYESDATVITLYANDESCNSPILIIYKQLRHRSRASRCQNPICSSVCVTAVYGFAQFIFRHPKWYRMTIQEWKVVKLSRNPRECFVVVVVVLKKKFFFVSKEFLNRFLSW